EKILRLFPAHGPTVEEGVALLDEYIAHRLEREEQIVRELRALGEGTAIELVARIYTDTPISLHPVAARSVEAHLMKLEREGSAARSDRPGRWTLIG
ncbi:MAG: MBL fold metallo-hydrolase, partial [Myxococcales bacterium]|nr:MBL fold metallo-hydrolase [Myxococcales bacterium]